MSSVLLAYVVGAGPIQQALRRQDIQRAQLMDARSSSATAPADASRQQPGGGMEANLASVAANLDDGSLRGGGGGRGELGFLLQARRVEVAVYLDSQAAVLCAPSSRVCNRSSFPAARVVD